MTAEFSGSRSHLIPERPREMALIRKSGREGNRYQRRVRRRELPAGEFDPQPADVVAQRTAVLTAEHAGQVYGVNINVRGNLAERQFLGKSIVEYLAPGRARGVAGVRRPAHDPGTARR